MEHVQSKILSLAKLPYIFNNLRGKIRTMEHQMGHEYTYLQAEEADKWPSAMILDGSLEICLSTELLTNHAVVAALADAVPLLPSQVQRLLQELLVGRIQRLLRQNVAL